MLSRQMIDAEILDTEDRVISEILDTSEYQEETTQEDEYSTSSLTLSDI